MTIWIVFALSLILALGGTKILFSLQGDDAMGEAPIFGIAFIGWIGVIGCLLTWFVRAIA